MITSIYAGLLALLVVFLSLNVVNLRRKHRVALGDGDQKALSYAIRAHGNALEYIPFALLLILLLELAGGANWLLHIAGVAILLGRVLHARAMLRGSIKLRVVGMMLTLFTLTGLAIANLYFAFIAITIQV